MCSSDPVLCRYRFWLSLSRICAEALRFFPTLSFLPCTESGSPRCDLRVDLVELRARGCRSFCGGGGGLEEEEEAAGEVAATAGGAGALLEVI